MSREIVTLGLDDYDEMIGFLNGVFTEAHGPHDFECLLPKIYRRSADAIAWNQGIREEGELRGVVGIFPIDWQVGDLTLSAAGIGGVATDPQHRGVGYMRELMSHCVERMIDAGYALSYLGGQRQRYQYYGYERCGATCSYQCNGRNFRDSAPGSVVTIEPLSADDSTGIAAVHALRHAQRSYCLCSEADCFAVLSSWNQRPQVVLNQSGETVGYLAIAKDGLTIREIAALDPDTAFDAVRQWVASHEGTIPVDLTADQWELGRRLGKISERCLIAPSGNWRIFDWPMTIGALMRLRLRQGGAPDGCLRISIADQGVLGIEVSEGQVNCAFTDDAPDIECDSHTAMRLLFGPLPPSQVMEIPPRASILETWAPLPLAWPASDLV